MEIKTEKEERIAGIEAFVSSYIKDTRSTLVPHVVYFLPGEARVYIEFLGNDENDKNSYTNFGRAVAAATGATAAIFSCEARITKVNPVTGAHTKNEDCVILHYQDKGTVEMYSYEVVTADNERSLSNREKLNDGTSAEGRLVNWLPSDEETDEITRALVGLDDVDKIQATVSHFKGVFKVRPVVHYAKPLCGGTTTVN